jgi:heat shock protein HslJ
MTTYTVDGETITIQPPASTRMMCPDEGVMDQEAAYLMMLPQAAIYSIRGDQLELRTADGALIALYLPEAAE